MSAPIIQGLWIGSKLSTMEVLCIRSFLKHRHAFHLYAYDEIENVPDGVVLKDASAILPADKIFKYRDHDSYAAFANLFRYKLLSEKGNYWSDSDMVCLKPLNDEPGHVFTCQRRMPGEEPETFVNCCFMKSPEGSAVMEYCYDVASKKDPDTLFWGETGPRLLTHAVAKFDLWDCVAAPEEFCPVNFWEWECFIQDSGGHTLPDAARAVHLWNEMWRRGHVDKSGDFPANSLYEKLKRDVFGS